MLLLSDCFEPLLLIVLLIFLFIGLLLFFESNAVVCSSTTPSDIRLLVEFRLRELPSRVDLETGTVVAQTWNFKVP